MNVVWELLDLAGACAILTVAIAWLREFLNGGTLVYAVLSSAFIITAAITVALTVSFTLT